MSSTYRGTRLGTRFGPYQLRSLIGVGGMGEVYQAYDTAKDRMVAVKLLRAEMAADPGFQERFRRESRLAARLKEPHVIPVHDFGEIDGVLYIDMRLVEGANLKDVLAADGPLDQRRATAIIAQIAAALDAAHADGLVHRDIKPENILLTPDDFAYLADFGIAHAAGDHGMTMTGALIGSGAYMATERFSGGEVGPRSDVYSLTCVLYECLTGRPPFEASDIAQLMSAHVLAPPPRPSIMRRGIGRGFDDVVACGMAKLPDARFATAGQLAKAAMAATATAPSGALAGESGGAVAQAPPPPGTRQFSASYPNPAETGHSPYPPAPVRPAPPRPARGWSRGQVTLAAGSAVLIGVAAILTAILLLRNGSEASQAQPSSAPPSRSAAPPTMTTVTPTFSGADEYGFTNHAARCDPGDPAAAMIRTATSLAVICQSAPGTFYYHGERIRDGANLKLADAVPAGGGYDVTNPENGARYEVRPDRLTISSNGHVDSSEAPIQYASG